MTLFLVAVSPSVLTLWVIMFTVYNDSNVAYCWEHPVS